jgi:membrane protein DedA with SNARE-associated domain
LAALASWIAVAGPGEAALVAAAVLAAQGQLDLLEVVLVAWAGATAGGVAGWLIGLKGGRAVITARGPLRSSRMRALERGERFYERHGLAAVFVTPSWMAGIAGMRWSRYLPLNALAALLWAVVYGGGAFFAGPPVVEVLSNLGSAGWLLLVAIAAAGAALGLLRRRRRPRTSHEHQAPSPTAPALKTAPTS